MSGLTQSFLPEPAVFVVRDTYHIMVYMETPSLMWVQVGDEKYYDDSNGVLRSNSLVHRMIVPMDKLNEAKEYILCRRMLVERKTGYSETGEVEEKTFSFRPVCCDNVRAYHIADSHNWVEGPVKAAQAFGAFDFLILNGDIPDHGAEMKNYATIYEIAFLLTKGEIPIVFARGNHDMRGTYADGFADFSPTDNGKSYYTFRLGNIWGMILDCGEDKADEHPENGNVFCCHAFRQRQIQFIKDVIRQADTEYLASDVVHKVVICHAPFTVQGRGQFDIENDIYNEWVKLLREYVKPDVIMNGHEHRVRIIRPGEEMDHRNQPCPVVVGSLIQWYQENFGGAGFEFDGNGIQVTFTDMYNNVLSCERL